MVEISGVVRQYPADRRTHGKLSSRKGPHDRSGQVSAVALRIHPCRHIRHSSPREAHRADSKGFHAHIKRKRQRARDRQGILWKDRKSTRLNSSHLVISYAVFCLKKKKT